MRTVYGFIGTDTMVRNSGMAKPSAVTVTSGSTPNP